MRTFDPRRTERGFSLIEILVVVAMIGIIAMVGWPSFRTFMLNGKMKSSTRNFITDVRYARQRAVTRNYPVKITFDDSGTSRSYSTWEDSKRDGTWVKLGFDKDMEDTIQIISTTFADSADSDSLPDIIFLSNGTIDPIPAAGGEVVLKSIAAIPKDVAKLEFKSTGRVDVKYEGS